METKLKILILIIVIGVIVIVAVCGLKLFSPYREIKEEKSFSAKEINEIQVNMVREHVHILRTETSNEVQFHYYGKSKQELKLLSKIKNKIIEVEAKCEDNPLPRYYDPTPEDMYLDIYIPENYKENISISITTGAVKMDFIEVAGFTLDTTTGGFQADQINAPKISIKTSTGSININKTNTDELNIKGASSAVNIGECIVESAKIETTSGGIDLKKCSGSFNIKANSGKVQVSYKEFVDHNISIATSSGSLALLLPDTAEFLFEANTSSGKLKSDFALSSIENKRMAGQVGLKSNQVVLKSSSGNISLLKNN